MAARCQRVQRVCRGAPRSARRSLGEAAGDGRLSPFVPPAARPRDRSRAACASWKRSSGVDLRHVHADDECCGFGGLFSVKHADISARMLERKIASVCASGAERLVSCDLGCLLHIGGGLRRRGIAREGSAPRGAAARGAIESEHRRFRCAFAARWTTPSSARRSGRVSGQLRARRALAFESLPDADAIRDQARKAKLDALRDLPAQLAALRGAGCAPTARRCTGPRRPPTANRIVIEIAAAARRPARRQRQVDGVGGDAPQRRARSRRPRGGRDRPRRVHRAARRRSAVAHRRAHHPHDAGGRRPRHARAHARRR